jgi:hypothetical protein
MPNNAGWATFEAKVRARRLAACLERAGQLIDRDELGEAREAIAEASLLAPDAPEIADLEQRINSRPSPGAVLLATPDEPIAYVAPITFEQREVEERAAPAREWPAVMVAVAAVVVLFFISGYGVVKFRHRFALPEFSGTGEMTPARDTAAVRAPEPRAASRAPIPEPTPLPVVPPAPALVAEPAPAQPSTVPSSETVPEANVPERRAQPAEVPTQPERRIPPPASPTATIGQNRALPQPPATSGYRQPSQSPTQMESTGIPRVKPLAEARPNEAVALEMTSPTPAATTGAQPMATLDAPSPAAVAGESRPAPGDSRHDESLRIRAVLLRFENAYNRLDAKAARTVWPGVNESALNRAFSGLVSQKVSLGLCDITVFGDVAGASCAGKARWEPKVGGGLQTADRYWTFQLTKSVEGWNIKEVLVR